MKTYDEYSEELDSKLFEALSQEQMNDPNVQQIKQLMILYLMYLDSTYQ
ncbi:hypothetical protein Octan_019 [Acinetobacter phage Octan]|uniref:Uncharacterized protein n=2 Tax=Lazarusvirus kimel TaxID=2843635 RepID=A0A7D3QMP1_9CAUD|nr:hypothetical protein Octan_019 [Acinetobacter phage Octan]QNO11140.1 hypothetical protein Meroveus_019 [Acinetobacter phage Meroveus]